MTSPGPKRIALVAHDDRKGDLLEWAEYNRDVLASHVLYATGTTGQMLGGPSPGGRDLRQNESSLRLLSSGCQGFL
jgi:hypothetical protein